MKIMILVISVLFFSSCTHKHENHEHESHGEKEQKHKEHRHEEHEHKNCSGHKHEKLENKVPEKAEKKIVHFEREKQLKAEVAISKPQKKAIIKKVNIPGMIKAAPGYTFSVSSTSRGVVSYASGKLIFEGREVKKGEILAKVFPSANQAHWTEVEQAYNLAKVENEYAQKDLQRIDELADKGVVPEKELLAAVNKAEAASANLKYSEKRFSQMQGGKGGSIKVKAPVNGMLRKRFANNGDLVDAGSNLFEIVVPGKLIVRGNLLRGDLPKGFELEEINIKSEDHATLVKLDKKQKKRRFSFDYRTLSSEIAVPVNDRDFSVGEPVELELVFKKEATNLTVPKSALIEVETHPYIVVLKEKDMFEIVPVTTGSADERVVILKGLKEADRIVVKGGYEIYASGETETMDEHAGHNH